jgi:SAM-dependent methyltransferase
MSDDLEPGAKARAFFDDLWRKDDYWALETSTFERDKYARQLERVADRTYRNVLEIGCGSGLFSRALAAGPAARVLALDVSPVAIERAAVAGTAGGAIEYRVADVMDYKPADDGPFDLIVMAETIYYLGWLYPFFNLGWTASLLFDATADGGRLLMTNTHGGLRSYLHRPWLIHTYRDLFRNVGYALKAEEPFVGTKNDIRLEATICLFEKPHGMGPLAT